MDAKRVKKLIRNVLMQKNHRKKKYEHTRREENSVEGLDGKTAGKGRANRRKSAHTRY